MNDQEESSEVPIQGDPSRLNELVAECIERWEDSGPSALEELCERNPELADPLRRRISTLSRLGLVTAQAPETPERLGDFLLKEALGSGGMGIVYRAIQEPFQRAVALKIIRPELTYFQESRKRFLREIDAVSRLQHPSIIPVYTAGEDQGVLYLAMELVEGCTLAHVLTHLKGRDPSSLQGHDLELAIRSRLPASTHPSEELSDYSNDTWVDCAIRLTIRLGDAIDHAHSRGILHRDVKPSNVMLSPGGRVLLLDFGLASTEEDARITRSGAQLGSLAFMAPEQVRGDVDAISEATDVYALGVLLYEFITLKSPFQEETSHRIRDAIVAGKRVPIRHLNASISRDLEIVCHKAMDIDPTRRYHAVRDFARDLRNILEFRPIEARSNGLWIRTRRAVQRSPARALSIAFAIILFVFVIPTLYFQQRSARIRIAGEQEATERALELAQEARDKAESEEARAWRSVNKARGAVDYFLKEMGLIHAVDIPLLEEFREDALLEAAKFYEHLLEDSPGKEESLTWDRALTLCSLSTALCDIGRHSEAEPHLMEALALIEPIRNRDNEVEYLIARIKSVLGSVFGKTNRRNESIAMFKDANDGLESLSPGENSKVARALLTNRVNLGALYQDVGNLDSASECFLAIVEHEADDQDSPEILSIVATAHSGLGSLYSTRSDTSSAAAHYETALEIDRRLVKKTPSSSAHRSSLVSTLEKLGTLKSAWNSARPGDSLVYFEEAATISRSLVRDFPRQWKHRKNLARCLIHLSGTHLALSRVEDAETEIREAISELEQIEKETPQEWSWRVLLGFAHQRLARIFIAQDKSPEAIEVYLLVIANTKNFLNESPDDADLHQQFAEAKLALSALERESDEEYAVELAWEAFELGIGFLENYPEDAQLRGTAYRTFDNLARALIAQEDVGAIMEVAYLYRDANPYKWASQKELARTFLKCCELLQESSPSALRESKMDECMVEAKKALLKGAQHRMDRFASIEGDPDFVRIISDPELVELLQLSKDQKGSG